MLCQRPQGSSKKPFESRVMCAKYQRPDELMPGFGVGAKNSREEKTKGLLNGLKHDSGN
jgi:hypothetical protein